MKRFTLPFIFYSLVSAQTISMSPMFEEYFRSYKSLNIVSTKGTRDSFSNLKDMDSNLSVVRADVLFLANSGAEGFKWKDYAIVARTKETSYLYFVARDGESISNMSELRGKRVSIGRVEDMAGLYLQEILIDEVEFQVAFKSYGLEESLNRIESGELDFLFAFGTADFQKRIKKHDLVSFELPEEFKEVLLKNEGFVRTKRGVRADNYIVVSKKIDPSFLKSVIQEFKEKKILLTEVDTSLGTMYPSISKILLDIEQEINRKKENEKKRLDTKNLIAEINFLKSRLSNTISSIKTKVSTIKSQSSQFKKESTRYVYRAKADNLLKEINTEQKILGMRSLNFNRWKNENNVEELERLRDELQSINTNLIRHDSSADSIQREIKIELIREREREEEEMMNMAVQIN